MKNELQPLSVVSAIVAVVALPSSLVFYGDNIVVAGPIVFACLLLGGGSVWIHRKANLPSFSFRKTTILLQIHDRQGKKASYTKTYVLRANNPNERSILHRNIAADGDIENFKWNGTPVAPGDIRKEFGDFVVETRFNTALSTKIDETCCLSYDVIDSFPDVHERKIYVADFPTKRLVVEVQLPADRPCKKASAFVAIGGTRRPIDSLEILNNNQKLLLEVKKPHVGAEYNIVWDW